MTLSHLSDDTKHMGDLVSVGVTMATIANWLPAIAALMTIVWTLIRIWETATVQRLFGRVAERSDE
jgi:hypothetical protein